MTGKLVELFKTKLKGVTLIPDRGGCFEVTVDGRLVFSKLKEGRFPAEDEVITARCDLDMGKRYRETIFNFAKHREPDSYRLIVERKGAIPPPEA